MNSSRLPSDTSRLEGCTVTGALAVSAFIEDGITVIHGPDGCAHLNTSLLHTTLLQHDLFSLPKVISSSLGEEEVIFGGEGALSAAISRAVSEGAEVVPVLSTCITETIGDDVAAVCREDRGVPVVPIPTSGFLGGSFDNGYKSALFALSGLVEPAGSHDGGVNLIGEKNLEFEAEVNYEEVARLLSLLGLDVHVRFVRNSSLSDLRALSSGCLNVVREDPDGTISSHFSRLTGLSTLPSFPMGLAGTIRFLEDAASALGLSARDAVAEEKAFQEELSEEFSDLKGSLVNFDSFGFQSADVDFFEEIARAVGLSVHPDGDVIPVPFCMPVGTTGLFRLLRQWRRFLS